YRCHPAIAETCNDLFYQGKLKHGVGPSDRPALLTGLPPVCFVDVTGKECQKPYSKSYYNVQEITAILRLLAAVLHNAPDTASVGVIALYKEQADRLSSGIEQLSLAQTQRSRIQISTVDAFQGSEKDVIILSCVRSDQIGFIQSPQRINVALSRAKHHLVVFGHQPLLLKNDLWRAIL
ncbi:AAA domain-containing protein, partial [Dimargaris cristalligena]